MKGVLQSTIKVPDPLAARRRSAKRRVVENNVHRRNVTVLSRIKTAICADHILLPSVFRGKGDWITRIRHRCIVDREVVRHGNIELLSARREILPPVEIVIRYHITPGNARLHLGLYRSVTIVRTKACGLNRTVLCDQCRPAQILVRTVRCIAPREFRGSLPHLRDIVFVSLTVVHQLVGLIIRYTTVRY